MTTEDAKQKLLKTRKMEWKRNVWVICGIDDQGKYQTKLEKYDDHLILSVPFADAFQEKAEEVKERILRNESSPIEYFMYKRLLEPKFLAQAMDIAVWRLKRHFKPNVFKKLDPGTLRKYANIFNVTVDDLINFREDA
ncbi:MAG: hypothetical protein PHP66_00175 [Syntrophales bacterium]|nr:hypothetical protein [Syntrophales bacterium]